MLLSYTLPTFTPGSFAPTQQPLYLSPAFLAAQQNQQQLVAPTASNALLPALAAANAQSMASAAPAIAKAGAPFNPSIWGGYPGAASSPAAAPAAPVSGPTLAPGLLGAISSPGEAAGPSGDYGGTGYSGGAAAPGAAGAPSGQQTAGEDPGAYGTTTSFSPGFSVGDAAKGASLGAALGPAGMALGAVFGGILGGSTTNDDGIPTDSPATYAGDFNAVNGPDGNGNTMSGDPSSAASAAAAAAATSADPGASGPSGDSTGYAYGGMVGGPPGYGMPAKRGGLIQGKNPGRADTVQGLLPRGAYVLPADVVSALGQGNTNAGARLLDQRLPGPVQAYAKGGMVPAQYSDGEYVVSPQRVAQMGGGSVLDHIVAQTRGQPTQTSPLPGNGYARGGIVGMQTAMYVGQRPRPAGLLAGNIR